MGFLDDTASLISGRTSHTKQHKHHHSSSTSKHRHHKSRDGGSRSRSRSRTRGVGIAASIFGGGSEAGGGHHEHHHHRHSTSGARVVSGSDGHHHKHSSTSRAPFFSLGNGSRNSFFGFGRTPSFYKRSPRPNFMQRALRQLKRLLRDLVYYAKRHPMRVFMLVIAPLITGGALTALLARFGLRLPAAIERMLGLAARVGGGGSGPTGLVGEAVRMASGAAAAGGGYGHATVERGRDGHVQWERRSVESERRGGGGGGWSEGLGGGLMGVAKMFM